MMRQIAVVLFGLLLIGRLNLHLMLRATFLMIVNFALGMVGTAFAALVPRKICRIECEVIPCR